MVREGRIVADYTKPLPSLSVPEIIQIVVVPTGEYTVELPSESGFVVEVRQHGVILASATTSFSFAVGLFVPYGAQWQQGTALYTAGTLTPVEQGAVFKFSFKADPSSVHALGIAYELANGMQLALNGEVLLDVDAYDAFDSFDSFDALNHLVVPASALKEENEVVVDYERTEGSFLAFGEEHERDITRTFMFNDTPYTVSIDAAATVYQLKNKAILVAVFLLRDV